MNDLENANAQVAFWTEVGPIIQEFEAAKESKKEDPERWKAAVQAMDGEDGVRTVYRALAQAQNDEHNTHIKAESTVAAIDQPVVI